MITPELVIKPEQVRPAEKMLGSEPSSIFGGGTSDYDDLREPGGDDP